MTTRARRSWWSRGGGGPDRGVGGWGGEGWGRGGGAPTRARAPRRGIGARRGTSAAGRMTDE